MWSSAVLQRRRQSRPLPVGCGCCAQHTHRMLFMQTLYEWSHLELCSVEPVQPIQRPCLRKVKLLAKPPTMRNGHGGTLTGLLRSPSNQSLPLPLQNPGEGGQK